MDDYIPFLKLKSSEILAVKELDLDLRRKITPFFDFPKKDNLTAADFQKKTGKMVNSIRRHLGAIPYFYIDNYDIDSDLFIGSDHNYAYLIKSFSGLNFIPVISIDRSDDHIDAICDAKKSGSIESETIAIRLAPDDFESYSAIEDELQDDIGEVLDLFSNFDIIFDCRVCLKLDSTKIASDIVNFINEFDDDYTIRKIVVTGSSIPASIRDVAKVDSMVQLDRNELKIFNTVSGAIGEIFKLILGDYGIVSPNYSDVKIIKKAILNITTAKIIYTFDDQHFVMRGSSLKAHPRGFGQYNDLAEDLVMRKFYRGSGFSYGDKYIEEKSDGIGKNVTPGAIIKPAQNAHIAYMMKNY